MMQRLYFFFIILLSLNLHINAQHGHDHNHDHGHEHHDHSVDSHASDNSHDDHAHADHGEFDMTNTAIHHISDGNVYSILDWLRIPLPTLLYAPDKGWDIFMSNKFDIGHHEDGHQSYNGYVMHHGSVHRVIDDGFPTEGSVAVDGFNHKVVEIDGKERDRYTVKYQGKEYALHSRSTLDGGVLGGGITSFYDFSITKNVLAMILVCSFLLWLFVKAARRYKTHPNSAPKGLQGFLEPLILFIRDDVAIPFIGEKKYQKYFPFLLTLFFFIFGLNMFGQIPFLGSVNATGNLALTMVLAVIVFIVVNVSGNKHYWQHVFWMPGVPVPVKPLLAVVEIMGLFIKPITLMLRLAGNISAGHIAILSFVGLIFILGNAGASLGGSLVGTALAVPLTMFMMALELIVGFVQAFVFTILAASYIGAAIEDHH